MDLNHGFNLIFRTGRNSARFGSAVANAGDLDGDGREELAVGAPFEDGGRGTVRIYYGKKDIEAIQGE